MHSSEIVSALSHAPFDITYTSCRFLPKDLQVVLFSATFPPHVHRYAAKFAPGANQITLKHEELTVEGIKQLYLDCENDEDKYNVLVKLYGLLTIGSSIIFVKVRLPSISAY